MCCVAASAGQLPKLSATQCTKLRHLTIVTLAIKNKVCYESCARFTLFTFYVVDMVFLVIVSFSAYNYYYYY